MVKYGIQLTIQGNTVSYDTRLVARVVGSFNITNSSKAPFCVFGRSTARTGDSYAMKLNRRTQWDVGSARIEFYRVDIARSCCGAPQSQLRRPFAAPSTAPVGAP